VQSGQTLQLISEQRHRRRQKQKFSNLSQQQFRLVKLVELQRVVVERRRPAEEEDDVQAGQETGQEDQFGRTARQAREAGRPEGGGEEEGRRGRGEVEGQAQRLPEQGQGEEEE